MGDVLEAVKTCTNCGSSFTERQSSGRHCFKCKVNSIGFAWRGPTKATKQNFHDYTIGETLREANHNIEALGGNVKDYEHVGTRWV